MRMVGILVLLLLLARVSAQDGNDVTTSFAQTTLPTSTTPTLTTTTPAPPSCDKTFSGLTTCAVLNGLSFTTTNALISIPLIEYQIEQFYNTSDQIGFTKSASCMAILYDVTCVTAGRELGLSTSTCEPIKMCFEWCAEFVRTCRPTDPEEIVMQTCDSPSAKKGDTCFGKNGWNSSVETNTPVPDTTTSPVTTPTTVPDTTTTPVSIPPVIPEKMAESGLNLGAVIGGVVGGMTACICILCACMYSLQGKSQRT
jgi:hypothetical protein